MGAMNAQMNPVKTMGTMREFERQSERMDMGMELMDDAFIDAFDMDRFIALALSLAFNLTL